MQLLGNIYNCLTFEIRPIQDDCHGKHKNDQQQLEETDSQPILWVPTGDL